MSWFILRQMQEEMLLHFWNNPINFNILARHLTRKNSVTSIYITVQSKSSLLCLTHPWSSLGAYLTPNLTLTNLFCSFIYCSTWDPSSFFILLILAFQFTFLGLHPRGNFFHSWTSSYANVVTTSHSSFHTCTLAVRYSMSKRAIHPNPQRSSA